MSALKYVWQLRRAAAWQLIPEAVLFTAIFVVSRSLLTAGMDRSFFSLRFHLLPYLGYLSQNPAWKVFGSSLLLWVAAVSLLRLFFFGGLFSRFTDRMRTVPFWEECSRHFFRFLLLFFLFLIPTLLTVALFSLLLDGIFVTDDTRLMVVFFFLKQGILGLVLLVFSYYHTLSRYRTVEDGKLRFSFSGSLRSGLAFLGYHLLGLFTLLVFLLPAVLIVLGGKPHFGWLALGLWPLGIGTNLFAQLAAFRSLAGRDSIEHPGRATNSEI